MGQKSKNLQKMADFGHFFLLTGEGQVGGGAEPLTRGGKCPPMPGGSLNIFLCMHARHSISKLNPNWCNQWQKISTLNGVRFCEFQP